MVLDFLPRKSASKDKSDGLLQFLLVVLVVIGLCIVLWIVIQGIYRLVCEARHNLAGAVRGANAQARRKIVQEHVVLDLEEMENSQETQPEDSRSSESLGTPTA